MAGTEYFGATAQPRDYPQPSIIFWQKRNINSSFNTEKLSLLADKHLWTYTRIVQVRRCKSHGQQTTRDPVFTPVFTWVKVHLQFCSRLIDFTPKSMFPGGQRLNRSPSKSEQYRFFLSQPGSGWLIRLANWNEIHDDVGRCRLWESY